MNRFLRISLAFALPALTPSFLMAQEIVASTTMELRNNRPHVQVMVNGKGPFIFVLDTGSSGDASVTRHLAEQLALPVSGEKLADDGTGTNWQKVPAFRLDSVSLAGMEFKNIRADQIPGFDKEFDGVLGFPLFRDYLLTLDYLSQTVTLARGSLPAADGKEIVPFIMRDKLPVMELAFASRKVEVCLDSGGAGLSIPARSAKGLKFLSKPVVFARQETVLHTMVLKGAQLASDIEFGAYTLRQPFLAIDPLSPLGNFGHLLLKNFAVTFDQNNKLVRFVGKDKEITLLRPRKGDLF